MATEVGAANIRVGATIAGLLDGMRQASAAVRSAALGMNNQLSDAYKRAAREQSVFRSGLTKLGDDLTAIGTKLSLFGSLPTLFAAGKAFKDYAEVQKLEKGLIRYGESLEKVREIAKLPNIGIFDGAKSLISLKAMKLNSDLATRSIKAFANAITDAGGSAIDLEPALVNLRQFVATKHINQVDLRQLAGRMPQTYDAMEAAFGTQDVEKLNQKMKAMGVEAFIDKFVSELEKIPKAGGGASTAMEQLGDSFTFFSASIGEGADKAFDLTGKIAALGGILDNLSTNFRSLTPEAQKSLFTIGAIAVVVPTLVTAIGGLVKLIPLIATGFGAVSGPIVATIAVVGLAAAAIINNWESVKNFLTDSTWWTTIVGIAKGTLGLVMEAFKVILNLIQGDWSNMWKAIVNIGKNAANLVVDTLGGMIKGAMGLVGTFSEALGLDAVGRDISKSVKWIDGLTQRFRFDVPDSFAIAGKAVDSVSKAFNSLGGGGKAGKPPVAEAVEYFEKVSEAARQMNLIDLSMKWQQEQDALNAKIKSYKELFGVVAALNVEYVKGTNQSRVYLGDDSGKFNQDLAKNKANDVFSKLGQEIKPPKGLSKTVKEYSSAVSAIDQLNQEMAASVDNMRMSVFDSLGEGLGDLMSGQKDWAKNLGKNILGIFSTVLSQLGKAMITYGVTLTAAKKAMTSLNAYVAIAAGVAAVAAGTLLKNTMNKTPRFAKGGFAYEEMTAIVGDNPNARSDPEMIAPYSKVDESIKRSVKQSGAAGSSIFIPELRLRGEDLYVAFKRVESRNKAIFGR
ncbi:tape measure protein [Dyadobacter sp. Leaf189]|uniref:tape measure protein n=1 Tax=Dyadobacter sp. Leaf189 TaxID=1736295 RepID=UPI0006F6F5F4|nr:tape measure protein [Dyadobacter sp. Leaf189]KQS33974.1 hypothetical protein ASG33_08055 [Dyadobacter sp. Leaf189]